MAEKTLILINFIHFLPKNERGRHGIPPLEPLLLRCLSGILAPSLHLRNSAEHRNKIFFFLIG